MSANKTYDLLEREFNWRGHEAARGRVEALLAVFAVAEGETVLELGRAAQAAASPALEAVRARARKALYDLPRPPFIGEEMAALTIDERLRALAADFASPEQPAQPGASPERSDFWTWARRGASDALAALIVADEISRPDFKQLTRAWRAAIGPFAPAD
jgi:hypothetical protein